MLVMSRWKRRVRGGLLGVLVLSGVTSRSELSRYSYQPNRVVASVDELER